MKLLYGTSNQGKLQSMKKMLKGLGIEFIGLNDIDVSVDDIDESGNNPLENAKIKALAYYRATNMPVFSCDSGLFIEGLKEEEQPGVHVRRVKGRELTDEEMIEYYSNLALRLGGNMKARYKNAICLVMDEDNIHEYDGEDISSEEFLLSSKAHTKRVDGFPLDSLSVDIKSREYYFDLSSDEGSEDKSLTDEKERVGETEKVEEENEDKSNDDIRVGFRSFFSRTILNKFHINI